MITGSMLRDAVVSASHHINNHRGDVDALNVFPVPDGDTGTNMSMTIGAAAREVSRMENAGAGEVAAAVALRASARSKGQFRGDSILDLSWGLQRIKRLPGGGWRRPCECASNWCRDGLRRRDEAHRGHNPYRGPPCFRKRQAHGEHWRGCDCCFQRRL